MDLAVLAPNVVFSHPSSSCVFQLLVSILKFEACQMWGLLWFFSYFLFCFFGMFRKTNKKVLGSNFVGMFFCFIFNFLKSPVTQWTDLVDPKACHFFSLRIQEKIMGISREHRRDRVALDIVTGTWADPRGSYYEAGDMTGSRMRWPSKAV